MKKLIPALLMLLFVLSCKKDQHKPDPAPSVGNGSTVNLPAIPSIIAMSPTIVNTGAVVTITGINLGSSDAAVTVAFNGIPATIQSVSSTEIKVVAPDCRSGSLSVTLNGTAINGPAYIVGTPLLTSPYTSGDVELYTQSEVDAFVNVNKGRSVAITGGLTITGTGYKDLSGLSVITRVSGTVTLQGLDLPEAGFLDQLTSAGNIILAEDAFTQLHFDHLTAFSGSLTITGLSKLNQLSFNGLTTVNNLAIHYCPLLSDFSFLAQLTSVNSISIEAAKASKLVMDKLTTINKGGLTIDGILNGSAVSFRSLTTITGDVNLTAWQPVADPQAAFSSLKMINGNMMINSLSAATPLDRLNFGALTTITGKLQLYNTNLKNMSGFSSLKTLGALSIFFNPLLTDLHGLEQLSQLQTTPAISQGYLLGLGERINGLCVYGNLSLLSLSGLQNLSAVNIIYITLNPKLAELCPLKNVPLAALKATASFSYQSKTSPEDPWVSNVSMPALTLTKNGNLLTTQNALDAINTCR